MYFLYNHLDKGSFMNCYADTDSMCLATTKSLSITDDSTEEEKLRAIFDPIVKPEMKESWERQWKTWFCTIDKCEPEDRINYRKWAEDQREPGKLKVEFSFRKGYFIALRYISYF